MGDRDEFIPYRHKPRFDASDTCKDLDLERVLVAILALRRSEVRIPSAPPLLVIKSLYLL
jgi:hypothetical protein